ncbi:MAG TPA: isoprenylcysteine carboxylmethyltransferase family protein [Streptosporangiaceae bacterium]|jgi:protein-S-isoprenylcysteine O-methyltransferase Ste14|nr:isoprenylcysteine carboxylmethyltransferase family protein [Streptosporangiaceae bacterium]
MAKMTPEQEAAYALRWRTARSALPPEAQRAYDRLAEQQARAAASAPVPPADSAATTAPVTMPRWAAAIGTAVFALIVQGGGVVLLPYAFTRWQPGTPPWPVVIRVMGVVVIAAGGIVGAWAFAQFAAEGAGVPIPGEPNSRRLTVAGPYRYVRNPLYVASVMAVTGQSLLLSRPVLLVYATAFLAITFFLVHSIEDPALARRFGQQFEDYRNQVPGWWPRLPRRTPATGKGP